MPPILDVSVTCPPHATHTQPVPTNNNKSNSHTATCFTIRAPASEEACAAPCHLLRGLWRVVVLRQARERSLPSHTPPPPGRLSDGMAQCMTSPTC